MFINTLHSGAGTIGTFREFSIGVVPIPTFNGGWTDAVCQREFSLSDTAIVGFKDLKTIPFPMLEIGVGHQ